MTCVPMARGLAKKKYKRRMIEDDLLANMQCKFCAGKSFSEDGKAGINLRFKCSRCGARFIPEASKLYIGFPEWVSRKEWDGE